MNNAIVIKIIGIILDIFGLYLLSKAEKTKGDDGHLVLGGILLISIGSTLILGNL